MNKILIFSFGFVFLFLTAHNLQAAYEYSSKYYTNSLSDKFIRRFEPLDEIKLPILVYHYVEYVKDSKDTTRKLLSTQPHILDSQIKTLKDDGYNFISFEDVTSYFDGEKHLPPKSIILTFDDGYKDFYTDVMPILEKYNAHATQYIIVGFIGDPNYMNEKQIQEIIKSGLVEIGAHTLNHYNLRTLTEYIAFDEILKSRELLSKMFGLRIDTLAYPYGAYSESTLEITKRAGFGWAVTTKEGGIIRRNSPYELSRIRPGVDVGDVLLNKLKIIN